MKNTGGTHARSLNFLLQLQIMTEVKGKVIMGKNEMGGKYSGG